MPPRIHVSRKYIEELSRLGAPPSAREKVRDLKARSATGTLKKEEKLDLRALGDLSERLGLIRRQAKFLLDLSESP